LVKILNDNEGEIKVWSWEATEGLTVWIKRVWWSFVELEEALDWTLKIVIG
jgi:hypothetical protein